eukprot:1975935-Pyramimonas_sp.AAC.1
MKSWVALLMAEVQDKDALSVRLGFSSLTALAMATSSSTATASWQRTTAASWQGATSPAGP